MAGQQRHLATQSVVGATIESKAAWTRQQQPAVVVAFAEAEKLVVMAMRAGNPQVAIRAGGASFDVDTACQPGLSISLATP